MKKAKIILSVSLCAALAAAAVPMSSFAEEPDEYVYGTMKIPYDKFYASELEGVTNENLLDAVSSATAHHSLETGKGQMLEGVWSEAVTDAGKNKAGNDIAAKLYGVVYPVAIKQADLDALGENNFGFEKTDKPETYKKATIEDGNISFSKVVDESPENVNGSLTLNTSTPWGDYVAKVEGKPENGTVVYGILLKTADGEVHALRHEQNIWRNAEIAWTSGIKTVEAHGNYLESNGFESLMGNKITEVDYITPAGYVNVNVGEVYVPVKFDGSVSVADTAISEGSSEIKCVGIPDDFASEYSIAGLEAVFDGNAFTFKDAKPGSYTLTAKDKNGKYADLTASFKLTTSDMPAAYDDEKGSLVAAENFTDEDLAAFIKNITSVTVNGKNYNASGRGSVKIVLEDGTIDETKAPFADNAESYEISVTSAGFEKTLDFTYSKLVFGKMNIPYDKFYTAEAETMANAADLDAVSSATVAKTKMNGEGQLFEGTYNNAGEDGSDVVGKIYGVRYPVAVSRSALKEIGDIYKFEASQEKPEAYKLVTVAEGEVSFAQVSDSEPETLEAKPKVETDTKRGDYMLTVKEASDFGVIYGVIVRTTDGKSYAMRHERNIWRNELAWSVGFLTDDGKGNTLESENMKSTNGATVSQIVYITDKGYITVTTDAYLPVKYFKYKEAPLSVEDADISSGKTTFTVGDIPGDINKEYSVEGLEARIKDNSITFANAVPGVYKLKISDKKGVYETASAEFTLHTADMPAAFDGKNAKLIPAEGFTDEQLKAYLKNITAVTVNEKDYAATGKKAVIVINSDGTLNTDSEVFAEGESFEIKVTASGYDTALEFTYPDTSDDSSKPDESSKPDNSSRPNDSSNPEKKFLLGDVDGDGKVDIIDEVNIISYINGQNTLNDKQLKAADVDGKDGVDIEDAVAVINHINGVKALF